MVKKKKKPSKLGVKNYLRSKDNFKCYNRIPSTMKLIFSGGV